MSGFKDFNIGQLTPKTKTLSTSLDEDDWDTAKNEESAVFAGVPATSIEEKRSYPSDPDMKPKKPALPPRGSAHSLTSDSVGQPKSPEEQRSIHVFESQTEPKNRSDAEDCLLLKPSVLLKDSQKPFQLGGKSSDNNQQPLGQSHNVNKETMDVNKETVDVNKTRQTFQSKMGINVEILAARYPVFTASEISALYQQFSTTDRDSTDSLHQSDVTSIATKAGISTQDISIRLSQMNLADSSGHVDFEGFLKAVAAVRKEKGATVADNSKIVLHGHLENTTHTINVDEKESFTVHINQILAHDKDLKGRLPCDPKSMQLFAECKDGLLLAKLINSSVPGTIDERVLNTGKKLNPFQITENNNVVINSAKAIGCSVVNIGSQDIAGNREHLILGLIWQIIKAGLQSYVDIKAHPELYRLLQEGETMADFLKLGPEQILFRWFNYHLKKAGHSRTVNNFGTDVKDGENYVILLNQLAPQLCPKSPLQVKDLNARAEQILANADKIGCRKYLTPKTLVEGNTKLNFAFVANLFNICPGLEKLTEGERANLDEWLFPSEGDREARAFTLWLNSLGVEPFVNNLFDDLQNGLIILQAIDKVQPGLVVWKKVNQAPVSSKFKKLENCNYALLLGKAMNFSLVGIGGPDIVDGNKKLTLALVWQLMREHVVQTLKVLSKAGKEVTDVDIIAWANQSVQKSGKSTVMQSFKDSSLSTGLFLIDLLNSIKPGSINKDLLTNGLTPEAATLNAKYAISVARKLGATIFVLPEDIVEVKAKMLLTFVGTLMALAHQ